MKIVPLQERHLPIVRTWLNRLPYEYGWDDRSINARTLGSELFRPELMPVAEEGGEPLGFLLGYEHEGKGWITALIVRADRQRQGIGTRLVQAVEAQFVRDGISHVTVGWCPLTFFTPGWDVRYTGAVAFMEKNRYRTERRCRVNLWVELTGQDFSTVAEEQRLREQGIIARRATSEDRDKVWELALTSSEGWAIESARSYDNDPLSLFVAEKDGRLINFACYGTGGPMYFGPLLTLPEFRGQGIASVTTRMCMADMQRLGWQRIEINWAGPIGFYTRSVGATIGRIFWWWEKELELTPPA